MLNERLIMKKKSEILPNNICFITHQLEHLHNVSVSISFKAGSLYESKYNNGISHLVEHLFFRQLSDLSQESLYFNMQKIGGEITGKTYCDYVTFSINVIPQYLYDALDIMLKFFDDFEWSNSIILKEKEVVLRQIENKAYSYNQWIDSIYFDNTKYTLPIMGTKKTVKSLTAFEINSWKKEYFSPTNSCVTITGNFSNEFYDFLKQKLSVINNFGKKQDPIIEIAPNFTKRNSDNYLTVINADSKLSEVVVLFDIKNSFDYESVKLITSILSDGCGSKLSMIMREKYQLTDDIFTQLTSYCGFHRYSISYTVKNKNIFNSIDILFKIINEIKTDITLNEYASTIPFFTDNQMIDLDNCQKLNEDYVLSDFILDILPSDPIEKAKKYKKILINDLIKIANEIFVKENISFIIETSINPSNIKSFLDNLMYH